MAPNCTATTIKGRKWKRERERETENEIRSKHQPVRCLGGGIQHRREDPRVGEQVATAIFVYIYLFIYFGSRIKS